VRAILAQDHEIPAARVWATRRGLEIFYNSDDLTLVLALAGRPEKEDSAWEPYLVRADLDEYDVLPPSWRFLDPRNGAAIGTPAYPQPTPNSVFHTNGLICAPWNRLAYQSEGGVHTDWSLGSGWKTSAPTHTRAATIPDMLDRIFRDMTRSRGRMTALPALAIQA
jgi:hypothetical protein